MASPPPFFPVATDALERDDISEVIPERLFITNWRSGSDRGALHNLKVTHIAAIGEEFLESEEDIEGITYYKHARFPSLSPSPSPAPDLCRYWRQRRRGVQDGQLAPRGGGLYRRRHPGRRRSAGPLRRGRLAKRYRSARLPGQGQRPVGRAGSGLGPRQGPGQEQEQGQGQGQGARETALSSLRRCCTEG
eukprot:scaffold67896_cov60-Phaeocystis_antarctica.AAC.1